MGVSAGMAAVAAALAAAAPGSAAAASHPSPGGWTAQSPARAKPVLGPPVGRPDKAARSVPGIAAGISSPWQPLSNPPPFYPGTMLLASDGTVLVHSEPQSGGTSAWYKLTPGTRGSYVRGTWSQIAAMPGGYDPLYFASAILPNGKMIVEGGEYLGRTPAWTNRGAIYNPVTGKWRPVPSPSGWANIGDAPSDVLANGTFMVSQACPDCTSASLLLTGNDALFNQSGLD